MDYIQHFGIVAEWHSAQKLCVHSKTKFTHLFLGLCKMCIKHFLLSLRGGRHSGLRKLDSIV